MLEIDIKKTLPGFRLEVAFSVGREIMAIISPSGSGKTMTLKCIAGLFHPDAGSVKINGRVLVDTETGLNLPTRQRRVGFVFQNYALFPHLTVDQNVGFGIRHLPRRELEARVSDLLRKMNLSDLGHRRSAQLSAGQQQRVALARALAPEPEVLLLDEPFSALDTMLKESLERELLDLQQIYNGVVLYVTHSLSEAYKLSSRIAVYEAGRIQQIGDKESIVDSPATKTVARLAGVTNLFDVIVESAGEEGVFLRPNGTLAPIRAARNGAPLSQGVRVTVGIRPEYILLDGQEGENTFPAVVAAAVEGVANFSYTLRVTGDNGEELLLEASVSKLAAPPLNLGRQCRLHLPPDRLAIITDNC